ncbi:twin-arginine translocation signal domain-containing protein [Streptomyces sp. NPDC017993]|uniref:twin-arginine translocation signal domain-containing protein n=1 Tax=Streptomyces sp. NPDC017993 TaxID=3365027 RepID=UPI003790E3DF
MPGPAIGSDQDSPAAPPARTWREALPDTSRRRFLSAAGAGGLAVLLAACSPGSDE